MTAMAEVTHAAVLFDFDGTLFDSAPDIAWCANRVREAEGLDAIPEAHIRNYIGDGSERLLHRCLTDDLDGNVPEGPYLRARDTFMRLYLENLTRRSAWYPDAIDVLDRLSNRRTPISLVTNKPTRFTRPLLSELACERRFAAVVCGDTLPTRKPDPAMLVHAAQRAGVPASQCVMVGDSLIDVEAARAAGMRAVFVTHGYCREVDTTAARADHVCTSLAAVAELLGL